jgi:general secretion pathway protein A
MDYLAFFNLTDDPFNLTPDPFFFYPSKEHTDVLSSLNYAAEQKEGFSLIVGEPGTGKTTILRTFMNAWQEAAATALIMTPRLSPEEFLQAALEDLNIRIERTNKNEMIKAFRDALIAQSQSGRRVIIVVDEAQNLPTETLEELRLLSNLETDKEKLLQIILTGQPELAKRLSSEHLKQLDQRIGVRMTLRPLDMDETSDYINFRLIKAGKGTVSFTQGARKQIYRLSKGIPRLINLLSSRSLMAAYVDGSKSVEKIHVEYARKHLSGDHARDGRTRRVLAYGAFGVILMATLIFGGLRVVNNRTRDLAKQTTTVSGPLINDEKPNPVTTSPMQDRTLAVLMDAHIRSGPSLNEEKVSFAIKGTVLHATGESKEEDGIKWYRVRLKNVTHAWISERVVQVEEKE